MNLKQQAAARASEYIRNGMVLGLGSGSTVAFLLEIIGQKLRAGALRDISGVPTSEGTAAQARQQGIPLTALSEHPALDLAIDGADEVDPDLNLIKGLGGALIREKIVEIHARQFIVIVDDSKLVPKLGTRGPLPVEVIPFGWEATARWLEKSLGCTPRLRRNGEAPFVSDNHNYILDCTFPQGIDAPAGVAQALDQRPGVVGHGLFLDMATKVVVASPEGIRELVRPA